MQQITVSRHAKSDILVIYKTEEFKMIIGFYKQI